MKNLRNILIMSIITLGLLSCLPIVSQAVDSIYDKHSNDDCCYMDFFETNSSYALLQGDKLHFLPDEQINVYFLVYSEEDILNVEFETTGVIIDSFCIDETNSKKINLKVSPINGVQQGTLTLNITLENGIILTPSLFVFNTEYGAFLSQAAMEDAMERWFGYAINNGIITIDEYYDIISNIYVAEQVDDLLKNETVDISNEIAKSEIMATDSETIQIVFTFKWADDNNIRHNLRGCKVEVFDELESGNVLLSTTQTDNDGKVTILLPADESYNLFMRVYASDINENVQVIKNSNNLVYTCATQTYQNLNSDFSATYILNMCYSDGSPIVSFQGFQIYQAVMVARDFATNMMGENPNDVLVSYPYSNENDIRCYYDAPSKNLFDNSVGTIYITNLYPDINGFVPYIAPYASWDVIMHEYGHHLQHQLGITKNPGLTHFSGENDADKLNNKDLGIRLAWAESWPTIFAFIAQENQKSYIIDVEHTCDSTYDAYNFMSSQVYDVDTTTALGEACERSIMGVLWDIYDNKSVSASGAVLSDDDSIALGYGGFWDITTSYGATTFSAFVSDFCEKYPKKILNLGVILSYYDMATTAPTLTSALSLSSPPSFSWVAQGGSTNYPNNQFQLVFYNPYYEEITRTAIFAPSAVTQSTLLNYTLTSEEWDRVLYSDGTTFYVAVAAVQTDSPTTGEYVSSAISLTKPTAPDITDTFILQANDKFHEKIYRVLPGQAVEITLDARFSQSQLLQTFGVKDVKMTLYQSNSSTSVWHTDDDDGYGFNSLINAPVTEGKTYRLRIEMYSATASGTFKFVIVPARYYTSPSTSYINDYEQITGLTGSDTLSMAFGVISPTAVVSTFTPTESGTYTVTVSSSQFYCFVAVFDPRSTEGVVYGEDYKTAIGGSKSVSLDIELDANVPYLIVMSPEAPSLIESMKMGTLTIVRKED